MRFDSSGRQKDEQRDQFGISLTPTHSCFAHRASAVNCVPFLSDVFTMSLRQRYSCNDYKPLALRVLTSGSLFRFRTGEPKRICQTLGLIPTPHKERTSSRYRTVRDPSHAVRLTTNVFPRQRTSTRRQSLQHSRGSDDHDSSGTYAGHAMRPHNPGAVDLHGRVGRHFRTPMTRLVLLHSVRSFQKHSKPIA